MFRALGASPTAVDGSEMYAACQTHLVDGTDLPLASIDSFKMYEVQKYASVTNHAWTGYAMVANPDAWNRLPPSSSRSSSSGSTRRTPGSGPTW